MFARIRVPRTKSAVYCCCECGRVLDRIDEQFAVMDSSRQELQFDMWLVVWFVGVGEIDRFEVPPDLGFMCDGFWFMVLSQGMETIVLITCCKRRV